MLPEKEPVTSTEAGMQVPDTISSQSSEARPAAINQPTVSLATDGQLSAKSTSKTSEKQQFYVIMISLSSRVHHVRIFKISDHVLSYFRTYLLISGNV